MSNSPFRSLLLRIPHITSHSFLSCYAQQNEDDASKPEETSSNQADHPLSPSTAPACCVVVSDPANSLVPEPSFSTILLADQHRRQHLFSLRQDMLLMGLQRVASLAPAPSTTTPTDAECASVGPPLHELIQFVHQAVASLGGSNDAQAVAAAATQEGTLDARMVRRHDAMIQEACCVYLVAPDC